MLLSTILTVSQIKFTVTSLFFISDTALPLGPCGCIFIGPMHTYSMGVFCWANARVRA